MKSFIVTNHEASLGNAVLLTAAYFLVLTLATVIDIVIWRKLNNKISVWLNLITLIVLNIIFIMVLFQKTSFNISIFQNVSVRGVILAIGCSILFFFFLDKGLDPVLENIFPSSEKNYKEAINTLRQAPAASFIHVCIIAPIIEEILMRGYVLGGLQNRYGITFSILISSILFALMHFNMVQTISALICGFILGILYINTGSIFCCILAHSLYNGISYFTSILGNG